MKIKVNGKDEVFPAETLSVQNLLGLWGISPDRQGVAVALNWEVVPRSRWAETMLMEGDSIEIIGAQQGG